MSIILDLLFPKKQKFNLRAGTIAHEDFYNCVDEYMKENKIKWSDLNCSGADLLDLFESYKDEEINNLFKQIDPNLPDIHLPY